MLGTHCGLHGDSSVFSLCPAHPQLQPRRARDTCLLYSFPSLNPPLKGRGESTCSPICPWKVPYRVLARDSLLSLIQTTVLWERTPSEVQPLQACVPRVLSDMDISQILINYFEKASCSKPPSPHLQLCPSGLKQGIFKCLSKCQNNYYGRSSLLSLVLMAPTRHQLQREEHRI